MPDVTALQQYIDGLSPTHRGHITPVSLADINRTSVYHISVNGKITNFIPQVSRRTAPREDRTQPRVSVSPTLIGCMMGYQTDEHIDLYPINKGKGEAWSGGWYIYGFTDVALARPDKTLVYDAEVTNEYWLLPYTSERWKYPASIIGKYFYAQTRTWYEKGKPIHEMDLVIEVTKGSEVWLSNDSKLDGGFWRVTVGRRKNNVTKDIGMYSVTELSKPVQITSSEYQSLKTIRADTLCLKEPSFTRW